MNRRLIGLLAALVCAALGTTLLVGYVRTAEARATEGQKLVEVLVVRERIPAGTAAADIDDHVASEQVPAKVLAEGAVDDLDDLAGRVTAVELVPGEQLVEGRFVTPAEQERGDLPPGLLEVTVALEAPRALGGDIDDGDTVGVVASFDGDGDGPDQTHLILHKVRVTKVQHDPGGASTDDEGAVSALEKVLVTLAVDAPSAERLVFAAEHGRIWLTAEPAAAEESGTQVATRASVLR